LRDACDTYIVPYPCPQIEHARALSASLQPRAFAYV